jgi:hypothetical protein
MGTRIVNKTITDADGVATVVKDFELSYDSGVLTVSQLIADENGTEKTVPTMIQPWKCNDDGSRADFVDETDAFDWFESVKNILA